MPALCWQLNCFPKTPGTVLLGVLLFVLPTPVLATCQPDTELQAVAWRKVVDGDTVRLEDGRLVRLLGINTPELGRQDRAAEPLAEAARQALDSLLTEGQPLYLQFGADKQDHYGRLLATVFTAVDGGHVGESLLARGLGWHVVVPPNVDFTDCLQAAERRAREQERGVWSLAHYAARPVTELKTGEGGFMRLYGRVSKVTESRRAWWIELDSILSLRLPRNALERFADGHPGQWLGAELSVRGWVRYRGPNSRGYPEHVLSMNHPAMLEQFTKQVQTP